MYISFCSPKIFGKRCFFEFDSNARPHKMLDWIVEPNDVLIWVWRMHFVISNESRR
jgi:hypothetical protein